jgi:hypothetical protein
VVSHAHNPSYSGDEIGRIQFEASMGKKLGRTPSEPRSQTYNLSYSVDINWRFDWLGQKQETLSEK